MSESTLSCLNLKNPGECPPRCLTGIISSSKLRVAIRNNKMNKTWLFTTLTLALVAAAPAHAISAKYREQLERSGCTQMTDGITCDIHKTKAENAAAASGAS